MNNFAGIERLNGLLSPELIDHINLRVNRLRSQSNITFSLLCVHENILEIEVALQQNKSSKYPTQATLIKRTQEVFTKYYHQNLN